MLHNEISRRFVLCGGTSILASALCDNDCAGDDRESEWRIRLSQQLPSAYVTLKSRRSNGADSFHEIEMISQPIRPVGASPNQTRIRFSVDEIEAISIGDYRGEGTCAVLRAQTDSGFEYHWFVATAEATTRGKIPATALMTQSRYWPLGVWNAFGKDGGDWLSAIFCARDGGFEHLMMYRNQCVSASLDNAGEIEPLVPLSARFQKKTDDNTSQ